jgi:N-acetylmuramoyl-L-alanine amidase
MFKISLSAGHGKNTLGKQTPDGSMKEWEFNSAVVKYLMADLQNYENVAVLRLDDPTGKRDIPLQERSNRANAWGANVHIDVHANAYGSTWNDANGIETFVYKKSLKEAYSLAQKVQANLIKATGLKDRGVKEGDLHMLRETKMTAILVECGFMTNKKEAKLLKSDNYRRIVAGAILAGLVDQYGLKKKTTSKPAAATTSKKGLYRVQVGAFSDKANAERLAEELKKKGYPAIIV